MSVPYRSFSHSFDRSFEHSFSYSFDRSFEHSFSYSFEHVPATIPGPPELEIALFVLVAMVVIPAIMLGIVLVIVRRRAPGLEEIQASMDAESDHSETDAPADRE
ncbi:hypothetical protein [Natronosalvus halobius]|uniref:hypothetical protein n=1 Tax=Natronosalvus halobius TaxID=2953746 RepID=UPI00209EB63D|nr:hypothetical protein [Natronosalvus halobius]USZ72546.1 hypothetical protein NGM15_04325 [Natronosalvus halobius]